MLITMPGMNMKNNDPACPAEPVVEAEVDEVIDTVRTEA